MKNELKTELSKRQPSKRLVFFFAVNFKFTTIILFLKILNIVVNNNGLTNTFNKNIK